MSLVGSYVQSQSGTWYVDPVVKGQYWFICWDDDDPIEVVIEMSKGVTVDEILTSLRQQGWDLVVLGTSYVGASRMFDGKIKPAKSFFLRTRAGAPTDEMLKHGKKLARQPRGQGVYYPRHPKSSD